MPDSTFLRSLLKYLRTTFFVIVAITGVVVAVALVMGNEAEWQVVIFVAIGMVLSSLVNAFYDARREKREAAGQGPRR